MYTYGPSPCWFKVQNIEIEKYIEIYSTEYRNFISKTEPLGYM